VSAICEENSTESALHLHISGSLSPTKELTVHNVQEVGILEKKIPYPYKESNREFLVHALRFSYWLNVFRIVCSDVSSGKFLTSI